MLLVVRIKHIRSISTANIPLTPFDWLVSENVCVLELIELVMILALVTAIVRFGLSEVIL